MTEDDFNNMFGGSFDPESVALDMITQTIAGFYRSFRRQKLGIVESAVLTVSLATISGLANNPTEEEPPDGENHS